ncbi:MAG TPA: bacteriohemerythrin [Gammaproteobacteria bacterium]|nr:bacteriohemerythrin [Gammaproteobacteria bacterium]
MGFYHWSDTLKVGHAAIDGDHRRLVSLVNQLHDAMKAGKGRDQCGDVLDELIEYANTHFKREEALMERAGFEGMARHKANHDKLLEQVRRLRADFYDEKLSLTMDLMNFLKDWLNNHIMGQDKELAAFLMPCHQAEAC